MTLPPLAFTQKACAAEADELARALETRPLADRELERLVGLTRRMAIAELLLEADRAGFLETLGRSARFVLSRTEALHPIAANAAFFDAVAGGHDESARQLADRSPEGHDPDRQYEEDQLFARIVMDLATSDGTGIATRIDRWKTVVGDETDLRLDAIEALLDDDAARLDEAIDRWMGEVAEFHLDRQAEGKADPDDSLTVARVSIEGLALVRLAARRGLPLRPDHRLLPSIARA